MEVRLRPYEMNDEGAAVSGHTEVSDEATRFLLGWEPGMEWAEFLQSCDDQRLGLDPSEYRVRGVQLAADVEGQLVGRASVRFELNAFYEQLGGHIGYVVLPAHRRKGYATEILRQALVIARYEGVAKVLMYCADANLGSSMVIESNGGVLDEVFTPSDATAPWRRYWIL